MEAYRERKYRAVTNSVDYASFEVMVFETDLMVYVDKVLELELDRIRLLSEAYAKVLRKELTCYIKKNPAFQTTLGPWRDDAAKSLVLRSMIESSREADVGPMAAVAGALAQFGGRHLRNFSQSVIVENGGDLYISSTKETVVGIFAGASRLSMQLGLVVPAGLEVGVCTSSGTVGHSYSAGRADAVCVAARDAAFADALATSLGNMIQDENDFDAALARAKAYDDVLSVLLIYRDTSAVWGELEIMPLR